MALLLGAIIAVSKGLGYLLPAIIGLESMGIPSPGETALILAAVLASQGKLQIWLVIVIGVSSAILGDNVGYLLGRRFGREVLIARGPFQRRRREMVTVGERFFERHGPKAVFLARWIALVRFAAAWLAGINHMRWRQFFAWNAIGGITWGVTYGLVGYFAGSAAADAITKFGVYAFVGMAVVFVGGLVLLRRRERRLAEDALGEAEEPTAPSADRPGDQPAAPSDGQPGDQPTAPSDGQPGDRPSAPSDGDQPPAPATPRRAPAEGRRS